MEAGGEYSLPTAHPAGTKIYTPFAIGTLIKNNPLLIAKFFPETNQNTASCSLISGPVLQVAGSVQHTVLSRDDQKSNRGRQIVPEIVLNLARNIRDALFRAMQFLVQFVIRYQQLLAVLPAGWSVLSWLTSNEIALCLSSYQQH